jgi:hypothetical protein
MPKLKSEWETESKKLEWTSPENCRIDDAECIIEQLNKRSNVKNISFNAQIIAASDFKQNYLGKVGMRIVVVENPNLSLENRYSTHVATFNEDGTITLLESEYNKSYKQAMEDLKERIDKEIKILEPKIYKFRRTPIKKTSMYPYVKVDEQGERIIKDILASDMPESRKERIVMELSRIFRVRTKEEEEAKAEKARREAELKAELGAEESLFGRHVPYKGVRGWE